VSANDAVRFPDKKTGWTLFGVGLLVGFLGANFIYQKKEMECDELADAYVGVTTAYRAMVFAECYNKRKYPFPRG